MTTEVSINTVPTKRNATAAFCLVADNQPVLFVTPAALKQADVTTQTLKTQFQNDLGGGNDVKAATENTVATLGLQNLVNCVL